MSEVIFLKIKKDQSFLGVKQLNTDQISIGSAGDVSVALEGEQISPWNSLIERKKEGWVITDLGSFSGTLVNGKKILEFALSPGDEIQIGEYTIEFFINQPFLAEAKKSKSPAKKRAVSSKKAVSKEAAVEDSGRKESKAPPAPKKKPAGKTPASKKAGVENKKTKTKKLLDSVRKKIKKTSKLKGSKSPPPSPVKPASDLVQNVNEESFVRQSFGKSPWKNFLPFRPSKKTFAPPSKIKNLDSLIPPGKGSVVEILIAWEGRIIEVHHSSKNEWITIGASEKSSIKIPNLAQKSPYPLVQAGPVAQIHVSKGMTGKIIQNKREVDFETALKKGVMTMSPAGARQLALGQNEVVRVNFHPMLSVYIRYTNPSAQAPKSMFLDFSESELIGIATAICFALILFFFVGFYYPRYLVEEEKIDERKIRVATIQFKPPAKKKRIRVESKKREMKKKRNIPIQAKKKPKKKTKKPPQIKKRGKLGVVGAVAQKPKKKKVKKKVMTSARSGGSRVKSKKGGSGIRSPRPDPTKVGLLSVFGKKGVKTQLDKVYSGAGELGGLADRATGESGTREVYSGKGIGTKFRDAGAGGKGSNLIGISGISTKGKGGGTEGFGRGGKIGQRGSVDLSFGISEMDVEGSVNKEAIKRVVRLNKPQLSRCHSMVLQGDPSVTGKIRIQWTIVKDRVTSVKILNNDAGSRALANCVKKRLRGWRFPGAVPSGGVGVVTFPFNFIQS